MAESPLLDATLCCPILLPGSLESESIFLGIWIVFVFDEILVIYVDSTDVSEVADIDWDSIGFGLKPTDYMYVMKCNLDGDFSDGELQRFGNIEVSPSAGVLNYGQVLFPPSFLQSHVLYCNEFDQNQA